MTNETFPKIESAEEHQMQTKAFYAHVIVSLVAVTLTFIINLMTYPHYLWAIWVVVGVCVTLTIHGLTIFMQFGSFARLTENT